MEVDEKNRFKLILLTSCAIHFSFILLFPALGISPKFLPEYLEVCLVKLPPKQIKKPLESKIITPAKKTEKLKITLEPKMVVPKVKKEIKAVVPEVKKGIKTVVPEVKKGIKTVVPEVSPVKISLPPAQKLPVLPPQVSEIEAPLVPRSLETAVGEDTGPLHRLQKERDIGQGERLLPSGERTAKSEEGSLEGSALSLEKAVSPVKKGISYGGEGEGLRGEGVRIEGPIGGREIERQIEPDYPEWAQKQGIEGEVKVKCWALPSGEVRNVEIWRTSGRLELDECAEQALMKWKFSSIKEEEIQWGIVTFEFELE